MVTKIQKWGNSLAVRLPKAFAGQAGIGNGSDVNISVEDGKIVLSPIRDGEMLLDELLQKIDESNVHNEIDFGAPVGKEWI